MKKKLLLFLLVSNFCFTKAQQNLTKAIDCNRFDKEANSPIWKSGTKQFCDDTGSWYLKVNVTDNLLKVETFAGVNNEYHKDKIHPVSIEHGKIINNTVYSNIHNQLYKNQFRYINGQFYELGGEGQYGTYNECKSLPKATPKTNYNKVDLAEKSNLIKYLSDHLSEVKEINGNYNNEHHLSIINGKTILNLMGQNFIKGVFKKTGNRSYALYFYEPDEMRDLSKENWGIYSKSEPIANFSIINEQGDLKMQWIGLTNRKTHGIEYDDLDADPEKVKIFKKD